MRHECGSALGTAWSGLKVIGRLIALIALLVTVAACGMEANKGSHTASGAASDYVSAIADKDYDRARALRDPDEFKQTVFDNTYFDNERARLGVTQANPQYTAVSVKDASGATVADTTTVPPPTTNLYISLTVVNGPSLFITTTFTTDLWYVSGIEKRPLWRVALAPAKETTMAVNLSTDRSTISAALQQAGYDLVGGEPNLIQARLDRGSQVVTLFIDSSGAARAQIMSGGTENEQRQQAGNMTYTIVQQGQLTINLTTTLQQASDITTLLPDIDHLAAGRPIVSGIAQASNPRLYPTAVPPVSRSIAASESSSGRVSASDFTGGTGENSSPSADNSAPNSNSGYTGAASDSGGRVSASDFTGNSGQPSGGQGRSGGSHHSNPASQSQTGGNTSSSSDGGRVNASDFTEGGSS